MKIHRLYVMLEDGLRMVMSAQGGMALEYYLEEFGWCTAHTSAFCNDTEQAAILEQAASMLSAKALEILQSRPWTAEEIMASEG